VILWPRKVATCSGFDGEDGSPGKLFIEGFEDGWRAEHQISGVFDLELDLLSSTVRRRGQLIELQPREFRLLEYLMRHASQVVTRTMLLQHEVAFFAKALRDVISILSIVFNQQDLQARLVS
jgi:hypothetical protein